MNKQLTKAEKKAVLNSVQGTILELEHKTIAYGSDLDIYLSDLKAALPKLQIVSVKEKG